MQCDVLHTIGASRYASDLETVYPIDPVLSTIGKRVVWLMDFRSTIHPVGYKCLYYSSVIVIFLQLSVDGH